MENRKAQYYTAQQLSDLGEEKIPALYSVTSHLVYSSPATLAYNSPGAEGFGVKRAGLALPDSVMLIVSPPCCGRNTSQISSMPQYRGRFFYLEMNETDLVTGRHLKMIPDAVVSIVKSLVKKPSVVMICATCVDALLGTDWDRVARAAEEKSGVQVRPCYMYALTREGRKPPMVHVRQSLYSLLEEKEREKGAVNLMGFFAPLSDETELYTYLKKAGVQTVRELSRCETYGQFQEMARARFNLVLNPECRAAADDLSKRLGMPYLELKRFYDPRRIRRQYHAFFKVLGLEKEKDERSRTLFEQEERDWQETEQAAARFHERHAGLRVVIGETLNADPFELALALAGRGADVREVYGTVTAESMPYITRLAQISPGTRFYCNQDPSMLYYEEDADAVDLAIGKDAAYYHKSCACVSWNEDIQPFGYAAVRGLYAAMEDALSERHPEKSAPISALADGGTPKEGAADQAGTPEGNPDRACVFSGAREPAIHGLRKVLTPFAPDQSGAVSVLYALGGMTVIVDAGGCTGNVCGFDEPRWLSRQERGAVFSAGLRDMDAILGRDDLLVEKLQEASGLLHPEFIALVGTPVPAVIGTDYRALGRMAMKKTDLSVLPVATNGMDLYDKGIEAALLMLMKTYASGPDKAPDPDSASGQNSVSGQNGAPGPEEKRPSVGVLGFTPMDFCLPEDAEKLKTSLRKSGYGEVLLYGAEGGLDAVRRAGGVSKNLVVSPAGVAAAEYLEQTFGIPYETGYPAQEVPEGICTRSGEVPEKILIVHQQVRANAIRSAILEKAQEGQGSAGMPEITAATWFMMRPELAQEGDLSLREEEDFIRLVEEGGYSVILADPVLRDLVPFYRGAWVDAVHFAVSGQAPGTGKL